MQKDTQRRAKIAPRRLPDRPRSPKTAPTPIQDRPKSAQDRPRVAQERPSSHQRATKERPRAAQQRPRPPQDRPKTRLKAILKPYHIFRGCWTRKSSETCIFKWFGALLETFPSKNGKRARNVRTLKHVLPFASS